MRTLRRPAVVCLLSLGMLAVHLAGCGRSKRSLEGLPRFDGALAFRHLEAQVALGYRYPGSPGHDRTREYLTEVLGRHADSLEVQSFRAASADTSIFLTNLIGHFDGTGEETVLLGAHWDTRPRADEDPEPANRLRPIAGANDGASGVAVLLELARLMQETPPPRDVDVVLFDAEDSGDLGRWEWCVGSRIYARSLGDRRPDYGIIVDMVGDRDLEIYIERNSEKYAYAIVEKVWRAAEDLGVSEFVRKTKHTMFDDHIPLLRAGVPTIVVIDFDYPYWHTLADTPDKCSPRSLEAVGRVLAAVIYSP